MDGQTNTLEEVQVHEVQTTNTLFRIPIKIQHLEIDAVIDTAAQVTIISQTVFDKIGNDIPILKHVTLRTAGKDMKMTGFVAGPILIKMGDREICENVYVAPIDNDMLLGKDLMTKYSAYINIPDMYISIGGQTLYMTCKETHTPRVSKVTVSRLTKIPPRCVMTVSCTVKDQPGTYILEGTDIKDLLISRSLHTGTQINVTVFNLSDHTVRLKRKMCVGTAETVEVMSALPEEYLCVGEINTVEQENARELPEHLTDVWQRSSEHLSGDEREQLRSLLLEFQDVFAKDEYDLGNFTAMEHEIDTGDARPVKQKPRRTPMTFVSEEEGHLNKMLEAGVIEPSYSDWSASPVLIRKRDGSVRWCVDYRGLNDVTKKDVYPLPLIEDCTDMLSGQKWFSKLDANSAYWQISIKETDRKKTAFSTKYG